MGNRHADRAKYADSYQDYLKAVNTFRHVCSVTDSVIVALMAYRTLLATICIINIKNYLGDRYEMETHLKFGDTSYMRGL